MKPFTPHDLRRTAASLMAPSASAAPPSRSASTTSSRTTISGAVPAVTGKHYDQDPRIDEKRAAPAEAGR